jgi:hypothetical protein
MGEYYEFSDRQLLKHVLDDIEKLKEQLEWNYISDELALTRLMAAPDGTPVIGKKNKRRTSEIELDEDAYKPNYHIEDEISA